MSKDKYRCGMALFVVLLLTVLVCGCLSTSDVEEVATGGLVVVIDGSNADADVVLKIDNSTVYQAYISKGVVEEYSNLEISVGIHKVSLYYFGRLQEQRNVLIEEDLVSEIEFVIYGVI